MARSAVNETPVASKQQKLKAEDSHTHVKDNTELVESSSPVHNLLSSTVCTSPATEVEKTGKLNFEMVEIKEEGFIYYL